MTEPKERGVALPDRMKRYERAAQTCLVRRMPVIIRVDGKAFHTLTRGLDKPFSDKMMLAMSDTAMALVDGIQGARLAYIQSDEISVLLTDFRTLGTQAWFDYEVQKMVSISAAIATREFTLFAQSGECPKLAGRPTLFDSRCFNVPEDDVCNYFIWRQRDAVRNSIQGFAQARFPHKTLLNLSCNELQDKLFKEAAFNWNDAPTWQKRGWCVIGRTSPPDFDVPEFSKDRAYIEKWLTRDVE